MTQQRTQNEESLFDLEKKIFDFKGDKANKAKAAFENVFSEEDLKKLEE